MEKSGTQCIFCKKGVLEEYFRLRKNSLQTIRCSHCGIVVVCNTPINGDNLSAFYSMNAFQGKRELQDTDLYSGYYANCFAGYDHDDLTIRQFETILSDISSCLETANTPALLDVGCATGVFLDLARKADFSVKGVEISKELSQYAREHFSLEVKNDLLQAHFPSHEFDVVTLLDVIEHFPLSIFQTMLAEIFRILKPGGILVVRTPSEDALLRNIAKTIYYGTLKQIQTPMHLFYSYEHILNFAPASLNSGLQQYGFSPLLQKREEENPERLNMSGIMKNLLKGIYVFSGLFHKQHKILHFYNT